MNELVKIIEKINGGNMFVGQDNKDTEKVLDSDVVKLFIDGYDKKYYYFAEYIVDGKEDNWNQIEESTLKCKALKEDESNPSDSYLILLWKVDKFDDDVYYKIINIEENDFFYKKYVLYYTKEEFEALNKWLLNYDGGLNIDKVLEILNDEANKADDMPLYAKFLVRIITKIPFWNLNFPTAEFEDFENMINNKIDNMRTEKNKIELKKMKDIVDGSNDANKLADDILNNYLKEWFK